MPSVSGKTRLLCVIGHPVAHSLSPFIQNTFIEASGLDYTYLAFDVTQQSLSVFTSAVKSLNIAGFNVTMPLKKDIIPYLAAFGESTNELGAVNTVVNIDGDLIGHNTDGGGFLRSLERNGYDFARKNALILGGGGAANAISHALAGKGFSVTSVTRRHGEQLEQATPPQSFRYDEIAEKAASCDLLVNATPLGMEGYEEFADLRFIEALPQSAFVYDLIYHPRNTQLLNAAENRGVKTIGGVSLLVFQAALSFEHFTGVAPAVETVNDIITRI